MKLNIRVIRTYVVPPQYDALALLADGGSFWQATSVLAPVLNLNLEQLLSCTTLLTASDVSLIGNVSTKAAIGN